MKVVSKPATVIGMYLTDSNDLYNGSKLFVSLKYHNYIPIVGLVRINSAAELTLTDGNNISNGIFSYDRCTSGKNLSTDVVRSKRIDITHNDLCMDPVRVVLNLSNKDISVSDEREFCNTFSKLKPDSFEEFVGKIIIYSIYTLSIPQSSLDLAGSVDYFTAIISRLENKNSPKVKDMVSVYSYARENIHRFLKNINGQVADAVKVVALTFVDEAELIGGCVFVEELDYLIGTGEVPAFCLGTCDQLDWLVNTNDKSITPIALRKQLNKLDYTPCRLPILDNAQLSDPEKGLWELWGEDRALCKQLDVVARDPKRDIQRRAVAIDFGTSSTVVACETSSGGRELLRIGVRDFFQAVQPQHFENPTVLECLDFAAFLYAWTRQAYRPQLDWNWMRAAHEAQASFRDNPGDTRILASILPRLKQWALRDSEHRRIQLTDRQGCEIELPLHIERNPLRGQALQVCAEDPFDPVELYAWYLGMAINWRGHGLFLKYYLSFPVEYPREVRERILASFRRGLQRSLPHTLVSHYPETLNEFTVQALASEPAAYAAAALAHLKIEPSEEGVPYAVYDFGGGTTDFDFGFLRWAKGEEEDKGYEQVFEHLANSGDKYLGCENLIEHLAYQTFQHNLDELRKHRIQFTRPMDAAPFAGGEAFVAQTQAAQTNTVMLSARLRPFLENEQPDLPAQIKLELIDTHGQKQPCELVLDAVALDALLLERMRAGVHAFLADLARVSSELPVGPVHVLLAGNGSRSRHIRALFDTQGEHWPALLQQHFGDNPPDMLIHAPLPMDEKNPHAPTAKTGVALGLLHLVPGENTLLIDHLQRRHDGQAPFAWFVGRMRRRVFEPAMSPSASYGHWHELGALQEGVFNLYTSLSPRAHAGLAEGDAELIKHRLEFAAAPVGSRLFVRACSPHEIELVADLGTPADDDALVTQKLLLG